jgi:ferredoxin-NADP reductase
MKFESKVIEIIKRTHDVKSIRFSRPSTFDYKAGQFMFVKIPSKNGELRKHFTISSSPTETNFLELTKKLTGSDYSNALDALKIGEIAKIDAPYGNFVFDEKIKKIAMLSGGIGITPLRSMCKYATDLDVENSIVLIYGNNTFNDIAYKSEFDQFQMKSKHIKVVHVLNKPPSNWKGYQGFINADIIKKEVPDYKNRSFFICGPPGMVNAMKKLLKEFKLNENQIKVENFTGY